jgi:hypothetical protein
MNVSTTMAPPHGILSTAFNTISIITEISFTMRGYGILDGLITVHLMKGFSFSVDSSKPSNH